METYSYPSYPESGDSSPKSREIDFENSPPWEDNQSAAYKVKFMCSYGGKIHPRPHDNQLSYVGGDTKILAVDRSIRFSGLLSKLSSLCDDAVCFKYQLPGEDLDALISVTNDDDLEHMMHEYDRLYRASPKPARLRLFLFPTSGSMPSQCFNSIEGKSEREKFVEALNSVPVQTSTALMAVARASNADFLFGSEKGMPIPKAQDPIADPIVQEPVEENRIQKHIQDLQKLQIGFDQQAMYRIKSEENLAGGLTGDLYAQKMTEKLPPTTLPGTVQAPAPVSAGYWPEKQIAGGGVFPASTIGIDQPVYVIPGPASVYHAPVATRPVSGSIGQGYYAVQRMPPPDIYREQPVYSVLQPQPLPAATQPTLPQQLPAKTLAYAPVAYDSAVGRQLIYPAQGGVVAPTPVQYQGLPAAGATLFGKEIRPMATAFAQEGGGKGIPAKASQASV